MNSSDSVGLFERQSMSFPGRPPRRVPGVLRRTSPAASRDASRARAASTMRPMIASARLRLPLNQFSSAGRTRLSTDADISGLLRRSFVWPWNIGSPRNTDNRPTTPSRMSSAVIVSPFG